MDKRLQQFARQYIPALKRYLADGSEASLETAYRLGRQAIASRLGVLDMARLYRRALEDGLIGNNQRQFKAVETFFLETLSPFEMTHRGFRETNMRLAQLIATLEERNNDLAALSTQVLDVQEEERRRISRELHDDVGQALTAITFALAALKDVGTDTPKFKKQLNHAQQLLSGTIEVVQGFARELRPSILDQLGLLPALRSMANSVAHRTRLRIDVQGDNAAEQLPNTQKTLLFRLAQERLRQVMKDGRARNVEIAIRKNRQRICMTITDDGKAARTLPKNAHPSEQRLTLLGMQERIRLINGQFTITTRRSGGTVIRVLIPHLTNPRWFNHGLHDG